jgi:uncharacterized protein YcbX
VIRISGLFVYPVKSCRGIALEQSDVAATGLVDDRLWLVVDRHGVFMTQRDWPALTRVVATVLAGRLRLTADGMPPLEVAQPDAASLRRTVTIWRDRCEAVTAGPRAAAWFSELLGTPCQLVRMPDSTHRQVDPAWAHEGDLVSFADGFPVLLISTASLSELNRRLDRPLPMDRFRPNVVVEGCVPHAEDGWRRISAGGVSFRVVKPCARCVITTIDQITGERGREPMRTLAGYRRFGNEVLFGQNLIPDGSGSIRVGDEVVVIDSHGSDQRPD